MANKVAGRIEFKVDGQILLAKGNFTYGIGQPKREAMVGSDRVHGFKEMPQVAFIEGEVTDTAALDFVTLVNLDEVTVTLRLGNDKTVVLNEAWYAADGQGQTEEGNIEIRFESALEGQVMRAV